MEDLLQDAEFIKMVAAYLGVLILSFLVYKLKSKELDNKMEVKIHEIQSKKDIEMAKIDKNRKDSK